MNWQVKLIFSVLIGLVVCALVSTGFDLMNKSSDQAFLSGIMLGIIAVLGGIWLIRRVWTWKTVPPGTAIVAAIIVMASLPGCYSVVEPGYVGIKVRMSGDDRGVSQLPLETGRVFYNFVTEKVFTYPTFVQTAIWSRNPNEGKPINEEITFNTGDQMNIGVDVSVSYHLDQKMVPAFYVKFRNDDIANFTHGFMHNMARGIFDATAGRYKVEQIMGDNQPFLDEVRRALQDSLKPYGVMIDQMGLLSSPRPPQIVVDAINLKVQATQNATRVQNEIVQAKAEAQKTIATAEGEAGARISRAKGEAEANRLLTSSLTAQLLDWQRLAIQREMVAKWNGQRPEVEAGTNGGPFIFSLPSQK